MLCYRKNGQTDNGTPETMYLTDKKGPFTLYGIGASLHEKPEVPNFVIPTKVLPLKTGMVLCIEPMITVGTPEVEILDDEWSAVTRDRSLAAHFEHCVAILPGGPEILDRP